MTNQASTDDPNHLFAFSTIQVYLEGPFAIVLQKASDNPCHVEFVKAFVPVHHHSMAGQMGCGHVAQHEFHNHEKSLGNDDGETHFKLKLEISGLECCTAARAIEPGFQHFNFATDLWDQGPERKNFVEIALPCPDRVLHSRKAVPVVFSSGRFGTMPLHHILEYQIANPNETFKIGITKNNQTLDDISLEKKSNRFALQVGLKKDTPEAEANAHALHFYNDVLLARFPRLLADQTLRYIGSVPKSMPPASPFSDRGIDVECHQGGGIMSIPA